MRILVLLTDAFGSVGGMAEYNRKFLSALGSYPGVSEVIAIPRLQPTETGPLPAKLTYLTEGLNSKPKYVKTVWKASRSGEPFSLIVIAHLNLLPLARFCRRHADAVTWLQMHGLEVWSPRNRFYRQNLSRIDYCLSVSETTKKRFCQWSGFPPERVTVVPNSVDLMRFTPGPRNPALITKLGLAGKTVLMTLGRLNTLERGKGVDEVMTVMPELLAQIPNLTYLICGDGTDRPRLEEKSRALGLGEHVVFGGQIPEPEKVEYYRLADAYVMPSRLEGFGIAFLEAMACGIPVVASKIDASWEAVRDPTWGVLVNPKSADEIKQGILEALRRPRARPQGLEYFSDSAFLIRIHHCLHALTEHRAGKRKSDQSGLAGLANSV